MASSSGLRHLERKARTIAELDRLREHASEDPCIDIEPNLGRRRVERSTMR
jgi:hypothetical protein